MTKVSIIGCGNMGGAIASALKEAGGWDITAYDTDKRKCEALSLKCASSLDEALSASDLIILAIKPQVAPSLYDIIGEYKGKDYISILAGVPLEVLEYRLPSDNIARFMPNIAARERKSVTALAFSADAEEDFQQTAFRVATAIGQAFILPEHLFPAFIGLSGSGIAYIFQLVHAMAMGGVEAGLPYKEAKEIVTNTLESAAAILASDGENPVELATRVCSAGGTTVRGMNTLSECGFDAALVAAVNAAAQRSIELEKTALERKDND